MEDPLVLSDSNQLKDFQCTVCSKRFSRKFTLEMHLLIHKGVKPHPCPFCGKCFRQKGTLMRHKALHSLNNPFHCSLCKRGFRQKNVFLYHLRQRHNVATETLDRRKYPTEDYQSLMDTLPPYVLADSTAIASSDKRLDAMLFETLNNDVCDSPYAVEGVGNSGAVFDRDNGASLEKRLDVKLLETLNNDVCDSSYAVGSAGNSGLVFDRDNGVGNGVSYKCVICCLFFFDYDEYKGHVEEQHNNKEALLDSKPILPELGSYGSELSMNVCLTDSVAKASPISVSSSNDSKSKEDYCTLCQKSYAIKEEFEGHLKCHVQSGEVNHNNLRNHPKQPNLFCPSKQPKCNTSFQNTSLSKDKFQKQSNFAHSFPVENVNSGILRKTKYQTAPTLDLQDPIQSCSVNTIKVENKKHVFVSNKCNTIPHAKVRFKCKLCNETFRKKVAFEYHRQMHMKVGAFECNHCKRKFKSKQLLLSHTRLQHMKTFKCDPCSRVFSYPSIFIFHKRNCPKSSEICSKSQFSFPVVDLEKLKSLDVSGITGFIPICDSGTSERQSLKFAIPVMSMEAVKSISSFAFFKSLEISGLLK